MMDRLDRLLLPLLAPVASALAALLLVAMVAVAAWAQTPSPQPSLGLQEQPAQQGSSQQNAPGPQPSPAPSQNPGLIDEMGKLFEKSLSVLPKIKSPSETLDDLNARAKDAGEAISNLAKPASMATGRIACPLSANGAPDCKPAADRLCQSKGYKEGNSLSTDAVESCSAKVLIPGRTRKPGDCRTDSYVTRALCQ
jgi:hypothetical protein